MIISFKGYKESGKTAAAMYLEEKHGFKRMNFKDALVLELKQNFPDLLDALSEQYGLTIDELFVEKPTLVRKLMQNYGTDVRRGDKESYWIEQWILLARNHQEKNIVVDDVRFINEAKMVRNAADAFGTNAIVIDITRDGKEGDTHISENEQKYIPFDVTITNDGTLTDLYNKIDEIVFPPTINLK